MKITIDTKHDTHTEIRKAIKLLYSLIGENEVYTNEPVGEKPTNIFEDSSPQVGNMMSLFDNMDTPKETTELTPEPPEPEKKPSLEFY